VLGAAVRPVRFTAFDFLVAWEPVAASNKPKHIRLQSLLSKSQPTLDSKAGDQLLDPRYLLFLRLLLLSTIGVHCLRLWLAL
jgi:hypothetical protein